MMWCVWRVVVWCALAQVARAYTVDCNHEYTDCDTELSKIGADEDEPIPPTTVAQEAARLPPLILPRITTTTTTEKITTEKTTTQKPQTVATSPDPTTNRIETTETPKQGRLLNLGGINVDELQNFASLLHNETNPRKPPIKIDLSDVNMDDEDDEPHRMVPLMESRKHNKPISDKFYSNLQVPFNPLLTMDHASEEADTCKENEVTYKIGEHIERGCEEICECAPGGLFDCTPRCKHPYIRRGRRLTDPLCFETPVDECCSIIACATGTGNHEQKPLKVPICTYNNETHSIGDQWHIGCEKTCVCETDSEVKCRPRCNPLSNSDKCINVQDPNDECCEVQVCDVSQDAHEEPEKSENVTNSTSTSTTITTTTTITPTATTTLLPTTTESKGFVDYDNVHFAEHPNDSEYLGAIFKPTPLPTVLPVTPEPTNPIGSVKVLQNNSVQVNLIHMNTSDDPVYLLLSSDGGKNFENVELKYSNLILNLPGGKDYILKTKETGAKFNFTITSSKENQEHENHTISVEETIGCHSEGKFYEVGEEFHIGCQELCECTGKDTQECVELVCPSHVGLELVSKGCVRWAPSPPASPPNCCPRTARCLSDGTCYYKGVPVPNWSEVSISLTGCEQRCFCENGELDCQEVCSPLSPVPPQSLRCPPMHRPAPVNISDDDCCKQWGCVPNAEELNKTSHQLFKTDFSREKYIAPVLPTTHVPPVIATAPLLPQKIQPTDFYRHLHPVKSMTKFVKGPSPPIDDNLKYSVDSPIKSQSGENLTLFTLSEAKPLSEPKPQAKQPSSHILKPPVPSLLTLPPKENVPESLQLLSWKQPGIMMDFVNPDETVKYDSKLPDFTIADDADLLAISNERVQLIKNPSKAKAKGEVRYFLPAYGSKMLGSHTFVPSRPAPFQKMFLPVMKQNQTVFYFQPKAKQNIIPQQNNNGNLNIYPPNHYSNKKTYAKHITPSRNSIEKYIVPQAYWNRDAKLPSSHLPIKSPNPYENVLLRPLTIGGPKAGRESPLALEQLVSQMEIESAVNRNLGRSADKPDDDIEFTEEKGKTTQSGPMIPTLPPQRPQTPPFLPTIPPEVHFPTEELPDYGQNDLHRPMNREPTLPGLPPGLTVPPNYGDENKKLSVLSLQGDSPTSVKLLFGLPPVLVGLRGSVDLRYTDKADEDVSLWTSQVFAPADEVLTTPRLEFRLTGLKPSTTYKIKGKLFLHNLPVEPESDVYQVRTMDLPLLTPPPTIEEKRREIDSALTVVDVNDTVAHLSWRHFSEDELRFIDGIQVRYRPVGTPIYSMTELLHHSRTIAELVDLRPGTRYEASLVLIPPPRATTELQDPGRVEFTTAPFVDPYNWSVTIEARAVGSDAAELTWHGVPSPAERWVRIYRAAHTCGGTRHEHDAFRLAARDLPPSILLNGLETNAKCRVWLELFMTNGKIKTSNVLEINTKSQDSPEEIDNEIELASVADSREGGRGDYYGALVVVGVVAALGALTSLLLLLVLVRRHRPRSVPITPVPTAPREASLPPYDNPAYKLELQQETMDL